MRIDPSYLPGGIADHQCICRHIFGDYRAGTDEAVLAERMSADDGGIRAYRGSFLNDGLFVFVFAAYCCAGVDDVREDHRGSEEHVVLAAHTGIDGDVVLDLAITTEHYIGRDNNILTDITVLADDAAGHDMTEMPDIGAFPYLAPFVHI